MPSKRSKTEPSDAETVPDRTATAGDVQERFRVTQQTVSQWVKAGCPHSRKGSGLRAPLVFDLEEVSRWVKQTGRTLRRGGDRKSLLFKLRGERGAAPDGEPAAEEVSNLTSIELAHAEAKLRKDVAAAELAELELERRKGLLLDAEEVKQGQLARIARAKAILMSIPSGMANVLADLQPHEIEPILRERVIGALQQLATDDEETEE